MHIHTEQPVAVAVKIDPLHRTHLHPCLGISLGIELYYFHSVGPQRRNEGNVMLLGHFMLDADEILILHAFD